MPASRPSEEEGVAPQKKLAKIVDHLLPHSVLYTLDVVNQWFKTLDIVVSVVTSKTNEGARMTEKAEIKTDRQEIAKEKLSPAAVKKDDVAFDATTAAYKFSQTFASEGTYYVVWHKVIDGDVTPFHMEEVFIARRFGFEKVRFTVATLEGNNGTPHTGATLYISNADGSPVTQGVIDSEGSVELEIEPGNYIGTLDKSGVFYTNNNVNVKVVDTLDVDTDEVQLNNVFQFITKSFTPTITPLAAPASVCQLFADIYMMDGKPLANAEVVVSLLQKPELFSGTAVFDTRKIFRTDHNGHVEFDLVQGLEVEISIAPLSLRRIITVPSEAGPTNVLTLLSGADDPFDVLTPDIPAAPRRTL